MALTDLDWEPAGHALLCAFSSSDPSAQVSISSLTPPANATSAPAPAILSCPCGTCQSTSSSDEWITADMTIAHEQQNQQHKNNWLPAARSGKQEQLRRTAHSQHRLHPQPANATGSSSQTKNARSSFRRGRAHQRRRGRLSLRC